MQCRYILLYVFIFSVSFTHLGANLQGTKISIPKNRNLFCKLVPCKEQPLYYFLLDGNNMRSLDNYLTILGKKILSNIILIIITVLNVKLRVIKLYLLDYLGNMS